VVRQVASVRLQRSVYSLSHGSSGKAARLQASSRRGPVKQRKLLKRLDQKLPPVLLCARLDASGTAAAPMALNESFDDTATRRGRVQRQSKQARSDSEWRDTGGYRVRARGFRRLTG
jgi:hypothetical protein